MSTSSDIPVQVLSGIDATEVVRHAIPPLSGVVVITWYDGVRGSGWKLRGPFADEDSARAFVKRLNHKHHAVLLVPVQWRAKA